MKLLPFDIGRVLRDPASFFAELRDARRKAEQMATPSTTERFFEEAKLPETMRKAADGLKVATKHYFTSESYLRHKDRANWHGVKPEIKEFADELVKQARRRGIPLYVHTALRTPREQAHLYKEGRSKVYGPIAAHTTGCAVDIVHSSLHWEMSKKEWDYIGYLGAEILRKKNLEDKISWGGDWLYWDPAHWQLNNWRDFPAVV